MGIVLVHRAPFISSNFSSDYKAPSTYGILRLSCTELKGVTYDTWEKNTQESIGEPIRQQCPDTVATRIRHSSNHIC